MLSDINISHGSVATPLMCGGICNERLNCKFPAECSGERILKIGYYLAKLWTRVWCLVFYGPQCRRGQNLQLSGISTSFGHRSIKFQGCLLWNQLPSYYQNVQSARRFLTKISEFLLIRDRL